MKISVRQEHIDEGTQGNACFCPVSLACEEAGLECPQVSSGAVTFGPDPHNQDSAKLPERATLFINAFDAWNEGNANVLDDLIKPFTFEINTDHP